MDLMTPLVTGGLLALFTLIVTWLGKGRFETLERQVDALARQNDQVRSDMAALRSEMNAHIDSLRSDILSIALAVGARSHPQTS